MEERLALVSIRKMLLEFPECRARLLGENLGIPDYIIKTLEHDAKGDSSSFFSEVINHWLNNDDEQSWEKLADAVERCRYRIIANEIRKKFITSTPAEYRQKQCGTSKPQTLGKSIAAGASTSKPQILKQSIAGPTASGIMASRMAGDFQLMIVGRMGKSTLVNVLTEKNVAKVTPPGTIIIGSETKNVTPYKFTRNGVKAMIWDTPHLLTCTDQDSVLRDIRMVYNSIDLFLLCIRMESRIIIGDSNYEMIKCLESQFSKDIWKKSLVVLVSADTIVQQLKAQKEDASSVASKFNDYMKALEVLMKKILGESFLGVVPAGHVAVPKILETDKHSWQNKLWEKCLVIKKELLAQR